MADTSALDLTALTGAGTAADDLILVYDTSANILKKQTPAEHAIALAALGDVATDTELAAHIADTTDAHDASAISNVAAGGIAATDVQSALNELDTDKASTTQLTAHIDDTSAAHAASAISASSTTLVGTATDVQGVLEELDNGIADHLADSSAAHAASAISASSTTLVGTATDVQGVLEELDNGIADHLADATAAHAASAISFSAVGSIAATDAQTAIAEVATDAAAALASHDSDSTNVHGIADTADLADLTAIADAVTAHVTAEHDDLVTWTELDDQSLYLDPRVEHGGFTALCDRVDTYTTTTEVGNTASDPAITVTTDDIGKTVIIQGAGASGATHVSTIASINSPTSFEMTDAAAIAIVGTAQMSYGTNDLDALNAFLVDCNAVSKMGVIPGKMMIDGIVDAGYSKLRLSGLDAKGTYDNVVTPYSIGEIGETTIMFATDGSTPPWDGAGTKQQEYSRIGFIFANSALTAEGAMDFDATRGLTMTDCFIATPEECVADGITAKGISLSEAWDPTFRNVDFGGFAWSVKGAISAVGSGTTGTATYCNGATFDHCGFAGYGTRAILNPGEAWAFYNPQIHRKWAATGATAGLAFMELNQIAGDINVTVDTPFTSDVNSSASDDSMFVVNAAVATDKAGSLNIRGGRSGAGGGTTRAIVEYTINNPIVVNLTDWTWTTSDPLVDFNSHTGIRLNLHGIHADATKSAAAWWIGTFPTEGVTIDGQGRKAIEIPTIYHPTGDVIAQLDGVGWACDDPVDLGGADNANPAQPPGEHHVTHRRRRVLHQDRRRRERVLVGGRDRLGGEHLQRRPRYR
jgi:hypothetical protein